MLFSFHVYFKFARMENMAKIVMRNAVPAEMENHAEKQMVSAEMDVY